MRMIRLSVSLFVFWVASTLLAATPSESTWHMKRPIEHGYISGSCTAIDQHHLITAAHCVQQAGVGVTIDRPGVKPLAAKAIAVNPSTDVAILYTESELPNFVPLAAQDLITGEVMSGCGYGPNDILRSGLGRVLQGTLGGKQGSTLMVESGDSGGGIFNQSGELAGVISIVDGTYDYADSHGITVHGGHVYFAAGSEVAKLQQAFEVQCRNGSCGSGGCRNGSCGNGGGSMGGSRPPPAGNTMSPVQPAPLVDVSPKPTIDLSGQLTDLKKQLDDLKGQLAAQQAQPGPPGPAGKDGTDGRDAGVDQAAIDLAVANAAKKYQPAIDAAIQAKLAGLKLPVQLLDPNGNVITDTTLPLDGKHKLKLQTNLSPTFTAK